jgi:hypothetical protein
MPFDAPVTSATFPSRFFMVRSFSISGSETSLLLHFDNHRIDGPARRKDSAGIVNIS